MADNLKAFEKISDISSRLIINQAALKIKRGIRERFFF